MDYKKLFLLKNNFWRYLGAMGLLFLGVDIIANKGLKRSGIYVSFDDYSWLIGGALIVFGFLFIKPR